MKVSNILLSFKKLQILYFNIFGLLLVNLGGSFLSKSVVDMFKINTCLVITSDAPFSFFWGASEAEAKCAAFQWENICAVVELKRAGDTLPQPALPTVDLRQKQPSEAFGDSGRLHMASLDLRKPPKGPRKELSFLLNTRRAFLRPAKVGSG